MSLIDKAKNAAGQAAAKAKETVGDVQDKVELDRAYNALGKAAFEAIEAGEVANPKLTPLAAKIRDIQAEPAPADGVAQGGKPL